MNAPDKDKLNGSMRLLGLHRGEARGAYDAVAADYDGFANLWDRHIAAPALEFYNLLIRQHVRPGALVLDAGAGTGERTLALLRNSRPGVVVGLDASVGMLTIARSKIDDQRVRFLQGDITRLPFNDNIFDVVSCTWAVEILSDPRAAVQEFVRVIKPDGVVIYAFCSGQMRRTDRRLFSKLSDALCDGEHTRDLFGRQLELPDRGRQQALACSIQCVGRSWPAACFRRAGDQLLIWLAASTAPVGQALLGAGVGGLNHQVGCQRRLKRGPTLPSDEHLRATPAGEVGVTGVPTDTGCREAESEAQHITAPPGCGLQLPTHHVTTLSIMQLGTAIIADHKVRQIGVILPCDLGAIRERALIRCCNFIGIGLRADQIVRESPATTDTVYEPARGAGVEECDDIPGESTGEPEKQAKRVMFHDGGTTILEPEK